MPSRYPSQLDDTDNLPTVRDNLTDLNGNVFNRLRDSILAIERSLGININGTFTDLASRLASIINPDGSLNKVALQTSGFIFGAIRNDDVDQNARIAESKLALNFPTSLLQDEIKILDARNAGLIDLILAAQGAINAHITQATGAHRATAIATDTQTTAVSSSSAVVKIEQNNVQAVLQDIFARHINFNPGISNDQLTLTNSPHQANQIFYDNRNTELPTNSVQGAIDSIVAKGDSFVTDHQRQLHSNGIQRRVERVDTTNTTGISRGRLILSGFTATVSYADLGGSKTSIFINVPIQQQGQAIPGVSLVITNADGTKEAVQIDVDDELQITDPLGTQYALVPITDLQINPVVDPITNVTTDYLVGLEAFYNPDIFTPLFKSNGITDTNPLLHITCSVYKKVDTIGNENGLNCVARTLIPGSTEEPNLSSATSSIQVAHPNAATIVSRGFNPSALGRRADGYFDRNFTSILTLVVDGNTYQVQIVPNSPVDITLDTCVAKANLEFLKQNIPIAAYRLGQEMALAHDWPDDIFIAGTKHTIRIISGGGVDASSAAGFAYIANTTVYGSSGNSFVVDGVERSTLHIKIPSAGTSALGKSGFAIFGNVIVFNDTANNPLTAGVRIGDIVNIQGITSPSTTTILNGIRRVSALTTSTITVNGDPYPVDVQLTDSATLVVYSNVVSLDDLKSRLQTDFAGLDPNLAQNAVVQVFINSNGELDYHERFIYPNAATRSGTAYGGAPTLPITNLTTDDHGVYLVDCSRGLEGSPDGTRRLISFQFDNKKHVFATLGCQSTTDGYALSTSLHGPPVNITGDGFYQLIDETGLDFITLQSVKAFNLLSDTILSTIPDGQYLTYVLPVIKFEQVNEFENLLLCNVYYNSQVNEIPLLNGDLSLADKRYTGTLGAEQIRDDVVEKYVSGPFGETRGDGVASGLFVPSDPTATQNITNDKVVYVNGGVVYVQGVRYEISSQQIYVDPATLDISQYGTDGYFPGTGSAPNGDGTLKNGYIRYYVFVDNFGKLQTTSRLNLPASLPFVPLAKVVLTTHGLLNNAPNIISINVIDFRLFIGRLDDKVEITVAALPQQPAHFNTITAALEYVDNMRYNDVITGSNVHVRPTLIRVLDGVYQEATTMAPPPYTTIRGESAHSVRIRPPVNLLGRNVAGSPAIDDTVNNQFIFNLNMLPEGTSVKLENLCFDLNTTTTPGSPVVPGSGKVGAIKITWFNNTSAQVNIPAQLATTPSVVDIKDCLFILDGPTKSVGIQNVFSAATPLITGGNIGGNSRYSYSYHQIYSKIYFGNYFFYPAKPFTFPISTPQQLPPPPAPPLPAPPVGVEPGPPLTGTGVVLDTNPTPPSTPEEAIFTDPNAPLGFNHGGIVNIEKNTFMITSGYGSICIDRFYDATAASGYTSLAPIPVSNTRMRGFKIVGNSFNYNGGLLGQGLFTPGINNIVPAVTPANTATGAPGQEAIRNQIYDLMIHKDLRGYVPQTYPNGRLYPDPKDGYNIPDGYNVPSSGGKFTEFMVISGNTPTGLNIPEASPVRFATESQDSVMHDNHGGGTIFATITVPPTGLPIIIDRSIDWHDRYVFGYANNFLSNYSVPNNDPNYGTNKIYTSATPVQNINGSFSFVPITSGNMVNGSIAGTQVIFNLQALSVDKAMQDYGAGSGSAGHAFIHGYTARQSGDIVAIKHPAITQFPGWSNIKYIGTFAFSATFNSNVSLVVMPNGALAALNSGLQDPTQPANDTKLIQTSDSFPAVAADHGGPDATRNGLVPITIAIVLTYSPRANVLTASQIDANTTINSLDNWGDGYGRVG